MNQVQKLQDRRR